MIKPSDISIIIPSKGRPENVAHMLSIFPSAKFCIADNEVEEYGITDKKHLLVHPNDLLGLVRKRQWILDNVKTRVVVQSDDDIQKVYSLVGLKKRKIEDPDAIFRIIHNTATIAEGAGAKLFGYTLQPKHIKAPDNRPFAFCAIVAGVFGILDRGLSYDLSLTTREDIDLTLQGLAKYRVNIVDTRFCFWGKDFDNRGGLQSVRTQESEERDIEYMKKKWGYHIKWTSGGDKSKNKQSRRNHPHISIKRSQVNKKNN